MYREWGFEMFKSMHKHCRTATAYGSYPDVYSTGRRPDDRMESFFLAETLKYHYLLQVRREGGSWVRSVHPLPLKLPPSRPSPRHRTTG